MNVVILSDHASEGGAAQATNRLEYSLRAQAYFPQHSIERVVYFPKDEHRSVWPLVSLWYQESEVQRQIFRLPRKLYPRRFPHPNTEMFAVQRLKRCLGRLRPDIINVHNLHAAAPWGWGPRLVEVCLEFAPVVWTLHDMWSFTGRCAYRYDCEKFITGCDDSCPTPHEDPKLDPEKIRAAWDERRAIYDRHREDLVMVTPSRWLATEARRGLFAQHRIEVIPYGFSASFFHARFHPYYPRAREDARWELGLQPRGSVLLLAAFDLTERRKGAEILPRLWQHIEQRPLTLLTMGRGDVTIDDPRIEVHPLGFLDDDRQKAVAYSAADALLHPAPVDNFPNVVLESLACGTPTIAMPVGGLPEMVRPGVSGWLAETATPAGLGQAVDRAVRDLALGKNLRETCRVLAETEYSLELQGRRYFQLFQELVRNQGKRG